MKKRTKISSAATLVGSVVVIATAWLVTDESENGAQPATVVVEQEIRQRSSAQLETVITPPTGNASSAPRL